MAWEIEGTDEFAAWFRDLDEAEKEDVIASVDLLEARGPHLGFPHTSGIQGSRHPHMRELRIQHAGRPYRVLYAFDPRRARHSPPRGRQNRRCTMVREGSAACGRSL